MAVGIQDIVRASLPDGSVPVRSVSANYTVTVSDKLNTQYLVPPSTVYQGDRLSHGTLSGMEWIYFGPTNTQYFLRAPLLF
jgi:hypothetical protein